MVSGGYVHLAPDHRPHARLDSGAMELEGPENIAVIRDRDRRHTHPRHLFCEVRDPNRGVEQRVMTVQVKMDEWRCFGPSAHGAIIPLPFIRRVLPRSSPPACVTRPPAFAISICFFNQN
jgi:hypothetical protein